MGLERALPVDLSLGGIARRESPTGQIGLVRARGRSLTPEPQRQNRGTVHYLGPSLKLNYDIHHRGCSIRLSNHPQLFQLHPTCHPQQHSQAMGPMAIRTLPRSRPERAARPRRYLRRVSFRWSMITVHTSKSTLIQMTPDPCTRKRWANHRRWQDTAECGGTL